MNYKIIQRDEAVIYGISRKLDVTADSRWNDERAMWDENFEHIPEKICSGYDGVWYGIWVPVEDKA